MAVVAVALWTLMPAPAAAADAELLERAEAGDVEAQFELGRRYTTGDDGTEKDAAEAARWFRKAAEQGEKRAQTNLAMSYAKGRGVARDDVEAVNWLFRAADQNHPRAMFLLAERFEKGDGVSQNRVIAYMWMQRAAAAGSPAAQLLVRGLSRRLDPDEREAARRLGAAQRARQQRRARPDAIPPTP